MMESNNVTSVENVITCALCSELYVDPRQLPCSHTYCFRCINQIISTNENHFECPCCHETKITKNDIDSLPSNQMIHDIVELYILMQHSTMCSNCDSITAQYICDKCQSYYCLQCYQTVHTARVLQNHQRMPINKLFETLLCKIHTDEKLKYWCYGCNIPVCSDCLLTEHKDHTYSLIIKAAKELETKIEADLEMIQSSLNYKIKQINTLLNTINVNSQSNKAKVIEAMTNLRQLIDEHEKQVLQDIENIQIKENQEINKYKIRLENQLKNFNLQKYALNLLHSVNDQIRLLKNKSEFFHYINQTTKILDKLQIPIGFDYHISGLNQLQILKQQIIEFATVIETSKHLIPSSLDEKLQIEKFIAHYQTSEEVNLNGKSLTDQNIHIVLEIFKKSTKMFLLDLSNNEIGHEGIKDLADVLQYNKILTTLDLSNNQIGDDGTKYLANVLKINKTLTTLYLYDNEISEQGAQDLADALKNNTTLTVLDLQSNSIGHLGAQYLSDALRKNNTLTALYLSNTQIGNQGAQYLADALQQNKTLTVLNLGDNQINHEAKRRMLEILKVNMRLRVYW